MEAAGIPLIDKLGRPVGIHTFRGTFISHLQKRGVPTVFRYGFKAEGKGDPLILHHLGKYAARRKFRAVRCAHDCPENAAGPQVHLAPGRGRAVRRPPQRKPRGPRFKQTVAREINVPAKDEFAFVRQ